MLAELCAELRNWFDKEKLFGEFHIVNGSLDLSEYAQNGQYFRIVGSVFNDGVYQYPASGLTDESFSGAVWLMAVPPAVVALASEIGEWVGTYGKDVQGPYVSESVPNYSYTLKTSGDASSGGTVTWQNIFASRLNKWRKI